jgi:catechol 2,3-dioxygenase-like lactoylglutathione lyase family enzyme
MVIDHIDLRVADVTAARQFYDTFLKVFGFRSQRQPNGDIVYYRFAERRVQEAIALIEAAGHIANEVRVAFHASTPQDVDRIAGIALGAGARAFEAPQWCPEIADRYYAAFFEDPSGNRFEVVCR